LKVILDTNVFISGVYFGGHPYRILEAWNNGRVHMEQHLQFLTTHKAYSAYVEYWNSKL
jgi:predicted nucleic acid-binding protein